MVLKKGRNNMEKKYSAKISSRQRIRARLAAFVTAGLVMGAYGAVSAEPAANPAGNGPGITIGKGSMTKEEGGISIGSNAKTNNTNANDAIAIGRDAEASYGSIVIGKATRDHDGNGKGSTHCVIIGNDAKSLGGGTSQIILGSDSWGKGSEAMALGSSAKADGEKSVTIGSESKATGFMATALGGQSHATGTHSTAIGGAAESQAGYALALGSWSEGQVYGGVALGSWSVADRAGFTEEKKGVFSDFDLKGKTYGAVSVGTKNKLRQIINVGDATEETDAVNLRQLRALSTKVDKGGVHYLSVKSSETGEGSNYKNDGAKAKDSIVLGVRSSSEGINGVVVGNDNKLTGTKNDQNNSVVIGTGLNVDGVHNIVVGTNYENYDQKATKVKGEQNTVIGNGNLVGYTAVQDPDDATKWKYTEVSTSGSDRNVVFGSGNTANGSSVAVGTSLEVENLGRAFGSGNKVIGSNNGGGQWGLALGSNNTVKGEMAVSVGTGTNASGDYTVSIGSEAKTNATNSIAMGYQAETGKGWSAAIGSGAKTEGEASTAVGGFSASATVDYGAAFGSYSVAQRASGVAGYLANEQAGLAWESNLGAFSVGDDVKGYSRQITGVAAGSEDTDAVNVAQLKALSTKVDNGTVHYYSVTSDQKVAGSNYDNDGAKATDSMVIGIGSSSKGINSTVIGKNNTLTGTKHLRREGKEVEINNSIVAGHNLEIDGYCNSVLATDYEDDTFHGLTKVAGDYNTVLGAGNVVGYALEDKGKDYIYTKLDENIISNKNVVIGTRQTVSGSDNVVIGDLTTFEVGADQVTTIGIDNRIGSEAREGVAIGNHLGINGYQTVAIGFGSEANAKNAIAFGSNSFANAKGSVAIGGPLEREGAPATEGALATVENGVALGAGSVADREAGMAGYLSGGKTTAEWQSTLGALSVGAEFDKGADTRQITGVAAGTKDTDAVNVAQLKKVAAMAASATVDIEAGDNIKVEAGSAKGSYKISATDTYTTGGTYDAETKKLKFTQNDPSKNYEVDVSAMINNVVDTNTTYTLEGKEDKEKNTTTISLTDSNGKKQQVTVATKDTRNTIVDSDTVTVEAKAQEDGSNEYTLNVKTDGKVEKDNKGIVTGGTVYNETRVKNDGNYIKAGNTAGQNLIALDKQVGANTTNIIKLGNSVYDIGNRVNRVGAGAAALAALHPLDFDPDDKWDFSAGYGNYKGANAAAIGAYYRPNEDTMFSIGGSFGGGENMVNAGVSVKLGRGSEYMKLSRAEMAQKLEEQSKEIREMKAKDKERDAQMQEIMRQLELLQKQAGK